jgi:dynein light chain Tctex-type 1
MRSEESVPFSALKDKILREAVKKMEEVLSGRNYSSDSVKRWTEEIGTGILKILQGDEFQPFKYVTNCMVLSSKASGVHTLSIALHNPMDHLLLNTKMIRYSV